MENQDLYQGKMKKIMQLNNQFEADMLLDVLQDRGIPVIIEEYNDQIFGETFNELKGWGTVWAEERHEEEIKQVMAEMRAQNLGGAFDENLDEDSLEKMDEKNDR